MKIDQLRKQWETEEKQAFRGWDFSYLDGRWNSEALPWDYRTLVSSKLRHTDRLLDMGTGGYESTEVRRVLKNGGYFITLRAAGFEILFEQEAFPPIQFFDVGAFVYFAKIIEWEFPGFRSRKHGMNCL